MKRSDPIKSYNGDKDGMIRPLEEKTTPPKHQAKKDTKRWCKGIEGREHVPVEVPGRWWIELVCDNCKKRIKRLYDRPSNTREYEFIKLR